jgi:hypothetical protein
VIALAKQLSIPITELIPQLQETITPPSPRRHAKVDRDTLIVLAGPHELYTVPPDRLALQPRHDLLTVDQYEAVRDAQGTTDGLTPQEACAPPLPSANQPRRHRHLQPTMPISTTTTHSPTDKTLRRLTKPSVATVKTRRIQ